MTIRFYRLVTHRRFAILQLTLLFTVFIFSSCSTVKDVRISKQLKESNCSQVDEYTYSVTDLPTPIYKLKIDERLSESFSFKSLNLANAIGLLDDMLAYINALDSQKENSSVENRLNTIEISQRIEQKLNFASVEISALSSEIDCEEDRTEQIANYLKNIEKNTETKLTVSAIVVGAVGAITTGIMLAKNDAGNVGDFVGIGSGLIEAGLGLGILINSKKIEFHHERNALRDVWEGREISQIFPRSIWYYLNYYDPSKPEDKSLRYHIVQSWMSFEQLEIVKGKKREKLLGMYFGDKGKYTVEQLKNRSEMYDQLESAIKLMKQDLKTLMQEIKSLKE